MPNVLQDLRFALRQLRRAPVFACAIIGTVALAVGATAAMSGILRATLLHPLPYPHPEQLVEAQDQNLRGFKTNGLMALLRIEDLAHLEHNGHPVFTSTAFSYSDDTSLTPDSQTTLRLPATAVSGTFFPTIATPALLGRTLTPADIVPNGPQLVVLSYTLWQTTFAGDPHVLGRTVRLGPDQATVIGVMPAKFDFPAGTALWHPGTIFPANFRGYRGDGSRFLSVITRLHPAETLASAHLATTELSARLAAAYPETDAAWGFTLTDLRTGLFGEYRQALLLLAAAVALVLLAAAINIAGLQLSRNAARQPELAVRAALGVSRRRLAQMLAVEALTPVLLGGLGGLALAAALLHLAVSRLPLALLLIDRPHLDLPVLAAGLAIALAVGLLTAAAPILQSTRIGLSSAGRPGHAAPGSGRSVVGRARTLGRTLSVVQIALALVLLTVSATVLLHLYRLLITPLGFDLTQLQTFTVDLPWGADPAKTHRLYAQLEDTFRDLPGAEGAGAITALPLSYFSIRNTFDIAGHAPTPHHDAVVAEGRDLSPGYLRALHIPLLRGRTFNQRDAEPKGPPVLLINHALAARYFADTDPVGKHLNEVGIENKSVADAGEIIGVIGDVHGTGGALDNPVQPEVYRPERGFWPHMQFAVRTRLPAASPSASSPFNTQSTPGAAPDAAFQSRIRSIVTAADSTASPGHFSTLAITRDRSLIEPRLNATLLTAFAALALLLVIIGVYGLVAFDVTQRTRELALRIALGSTRTGILRLLLTESARMLGVGLALGLLASWAATRILMTAATTLAAHAPPPLLALAAALLAAAVLVATLVPARRAARTDPMQALRSE